MKKIKIKKEIIVNEEAVINDLKTLYGIPPHDTWSNYCAGDGYFARSLEDKYGCSIEELRKAVDFDSIEQRWNNIRRNFK